jgi:hypothetical protein
MIPLRPFSGSSSPRPSGGANRSATCQSWHERFDNGVPATDVQKGEKIETKGLIPIARLARVRTS